MTKKRDKIPQKVGFSVKKRDKLEILDKITQFRVKNGHFGGMKKWDKGKKKWDSRKFGSKKRDCSSKIGTVDKYAF